eukprot:271662_1
MGQTQMGQTQTNDNNEWINFVLNTDSDSLFQTKCRTIQQPGAIEPLLCEEKHNREEKKPEAKMELELYGIKCEGLCEESYDVDKVFICKHLECANNCGIYCEDCSEFKHRRKAHRFHPSARYVVSVQDLYKPHQNNFKDAKKKAKIAVNITKVEKFLFHHRWSMGAMKLLGTSGVTIANAAVTGASTVAGHTISVLGMGSALGAAGAVIATAVEAGFIWRQWKKDRITTKEACALALISSVSNGTAVGAGVGGAALGAKIGAAVGISGGPIGIAIGIGIGALLGLLCRLALNKGFEIYFKDKNKLEKKLVGKALKMFFDDEKYDIEDKKKFNDKILRRRYRRLALIHHPEREGGDKKEWLRLSSYYGILTGMWEQMNEESVQIHSGDDLNEEQRLLVQNEAIKDDANRFQLEMTEDVNF